MTVKGRFTTLNDYIKADRLNKYMGAKIKHRETESVETDSEFV